MRDTERTGGIQVISRAAAILRALRDNGTGMSLGEIATCVDLPRSTVQRIVGALQQEQLVSASGKRGSLKLGPELRRMADAAPFDVVATCRPILDEIAAATGETVDLARYQDQSMVFIDQVPGRHRLRAVSAIGDAFPLTTTANGLAALALMLENDWLVAVETEMDKPESPGNLADLMQRIDTVRTEGLAYDLDCHTNGISAIGIAFKDWGGAIHSISVPMPSSRYENGRETVRKALMEAKSELAGAFAS